MSKEAMKLALEALEMYQSKSSVQMFDAAITALREALAEQPAPAQEPVARAMTAERALYFMERFKHEEKLLGPNEQAALDFVISMLEAPPQRQPLTDEQIEAINVSFSGKRDLARMFARAIEAAHGIKGDT